MEKKEYICKICDKFYKNYKSLWKHNYVYHKDSVVKMSTNTTTPIKDCLQNVSTNIVDKINVCKYCQKELSDRKSRWRHEQKCKGISKIIELENKISDLINNQDKQKELINSQNIEIENQQNILKSMKIHPKKLEKINTQLNNQAINNGIIINNNIVPLGKEKLENKLTEKQKLLILNASNNAHTALTDLIYTNPEFKEYRNVYITNLSNGIGYIYDNKKNQYIVKSKKFIMNNYSDERIWDIENFLAELNDKLDDIIVNKVETLINDYFKDEEFNDKIKKELLFTLYNNKIHVKKIYESCNEETIDL